MESWIYLTEPEALCSNNGSNQLRSGGQTLPGDGSQCYMQLTVRGFASIIRVCSLHVSTVRKVSSSSGIAIYLGAYTSKHHELSSELHLCFRIQKDFMDHWHEIRVSFMSQKITRLLNTVPFIVGIVWPAVPDSALALGACLHTKIRFSESSFEFWVVLQHTSCERFMPWRGAPVSLKLDMKVLLCMYV